MPIELTKDSIDLGIVVSDIDASLAFYRDLLGFIPDGEMPMPGGGTMHRLLCGTSLIKLVETDAPPPAVAPRGGIQGATGYRYWTITVANLEQLTADCAAAGHKVPVPVTVLRPGVMISIVEDPDRNLVEFVQRS
jgi:glyoxylase I family protein